MYGTWKILNKSKLSSHFLLLSVQKFQVLQHRTPKPLPQSTPIISKREIDKIFMARTIQIKPFPKPQGKSDIFSYSLLDLYFLQSCSFNHYGNLWPPSLPPSVFSFLVVCVPGFGLQLHWILFFPWKAKPSIFLFFYSFSRENKFSFPLHYTLWSRQVILLILRISKGIWEAWWFPKSQRHQQK